MRKLIIKLFSIVLLINVSISSFSQVQQNQVSQSNNHAFINGFIVSAVYDDNIVHLIWDEHTIAGKHHSTVFIEKSFDGINWSLLASMPLDDIFDIHINNYPEDVETIGNILYSTEVGNGRFIYNDVCNNGEMDNPLVRYRAGFITGDGKYLYTAEVDVNSHKDESGWRIADDIIITETSEESKDKKPPVLTTKTVCPAVGSAPSGSTNTGQTQVFYGTCCTWTETLYTLPATFQITCGGSSYAWCCNNVSGVSGCTSGYWWDPCCVHTCTQFGSCSCHPWNCCNMISGQNIWVVTSSTPFSGFQVTSQVTNESCPNTVDGSIVLSPVGGTAPFTYAWAGGQTSNSLYFLQSGSYSCTVTDANGCTVPLSVNITSNPNPVPNAGSDVDICSGGSTTLTATGGVAYLWSTGSTNQSIIVNPPTTQTYTVTVANTFGCTASDNVVVNVYNITSPFTVTTPICLENTSTILYTGNATGAATYNWNFNGGTVISGSGAGPLSVQWSSGGQHNVSLTVNEPGCNASTPTTMQVNVIDVTAIKIENAPLCNGSSDGSVMVIAGGGQTPYNYLWSPGGATTGGLTGIPAGSYIVTITDALGCVQTDTLTINNPPLLNASIMNTTQVSCFGGNDGSSIVSVSGGTSPYSYTWQPSVGTSNSISGLTVGTYSVTVTDANSCTDTESVTITEPPLLISAISDSTDLVCNGIPTGSATVAAVGGISPYSYLWSSAPAQTNAAAVNLPAGTYTVTVTDANSCISTSTVSLSQPTPITLNVTPKNENCKDDCNGEIEVTASGGTPNYTYVWNTTPAQTSSTANNLCVGAWKVTVTDANGCTKTDSALIITNSLITALANAYPTSGFIPIAVNFFFTGSGAFSYNWDFGDGNISTDQNPVHVYTTSGLFNVILTVNSGAPDFCEDIYVITLSFEKPSSVLIPNVFTPNGDGYNDVFKVESVSMSEESMIIFNRWGKKVFEWTNLGGTWDGEKHSDGTYYYIYYGKGRDDKEYNFNGTVTLLRSK